MNPDPRAAHQAIQNANQAIQSGDRQTARRWAEQAAALAPDMEEPWLILASLASPRASVAYLEQALKINPQSERARRGKQWAVERLQSGDTGERISARERHTSTPAVVQPKDPARPRTLRGDQDSVPNRITAPLVNLPRGETAEQNLISRRHSFWPLILLIACVTVALIVWPGNASPALAFIHGNVDEPQATPSLPGGPADMAKPTYTPTSTATFTPTPTFTPTLTFTPTPTPTDTPPPTPTDTPSPIPTDTPSPNPWPTSTSFLPATEEPYISPGGYGSERWIDIDLTNQRLYAYEGNNVVDSFVVSTGTWQYPTVTGQYHIYLKLVSATMTGPGYYLTNVPYIMYFYKSYGIHGTYWHNNFGVPMSHGCVNMRTSDAAWLFDWASIGTLVNVHY